MLENAPTVSVVIPCFNAGSFVREAIASVLAQTHTVDEVVCVDDGSTDNTLAVLREQAAVSPVPFEVLTGPNGGASRARNRGTSASRGDYIQYLDADDVLVPQKIEHQLGLVQRCAIPPALVAAAYFAVDSREGAPRQQVDVEEDWWAALLCGRLGITSSNLWSRVAVLRAGGWNEARQTSEDIEMVFRMLKGGAPIESPQ